MSDNKSGKQPSTVKKGIATNIPGTRTVKQSNNLPTFNNPPPPPPPKKNK